MKKHKDLFHASNDILLAIIILSIAAVLIWWRVDAIMAYPDTLVSTHKTVAKEEKNEKKSVSHEDIKKKLNDEKSEVDKEKNKISGSQLWKNDVLSKEVSITIEPNSIEGAVKTIVSSGLLSSYSEYLSICEQEGIDPNTLKAGSFTFTKGSKKSDVVRIVTQ